MTDLTIWPIKVMSLEEIARLYQIPSHLLDSLHPRESVSAMSVGQELLDAANGSYRRKQSEKKGVNIYKGIYFGTAVSSAMQQAYKEGKRRDRRNLAEELVIKTFDKARATATTRLDAVAACVGPANSMVRNASGEMNELEAIAQEVWNDLDAQDTVNRRRFGKTYEAISTLIDPSVIISFIMQLITMIRNCKNPPVPAPV